MIDVKNLNPEEEGLYDLFMKTLPLASFFHSLKYRNLLQRMLPNSDPAYLIAKIDGRMAGALPAFIRRSKTGNVLNSLPFYGSHGGALAANSVDAAEIKRQLLRRIRQIAIEEQCLTSTIVTPLFEADMSAYEEGACFDFRDSRIGQVTRLPDGREDLDRRLMAIFHSKTRNMVRKAYRSDIDYYESSSESDLDFIAELHAVNSAALGIVAKKQEFFSLIPTIFTYGEDYKIYVASMNRKKIAALLLFYHNQTVEYFTPCIREEFRSQQPLSLLIFEGMKDASVRGYRYWNWGGTASGLESIYRFKKRWGAADHNYYYYTTKHLDVTPLLKLGRRGILMDYSYFYTVPFSLLDH